MSIRTITTIWLKELKDSTRDRRTMLVMVLMPLILMPMLLVGITKFSQFQQQQAEEKTVKVAINPDQIEHPLAAVIKQQPKVDLTEREGNLSELVQQEEVDAAIALYLQGQNGQAADAPKVRLWQKSVNDISAQAQLRISAAIEAYNTQIIAHRLAQQGIDQSILVGAALDPIDVASSQEKSGFGLSFILPLFIVMWAITGGMYTAIDASAGERERKTLEALLLTPASRLEIVAGKFLAVSTVSLVSICLALASLYASFRYVIDSLSAQSGITGSAFSQFNAADSLTLPAISLMLLTSILLALLFAAILLTAGIFAKSFREAQSYISPIYLVAIIPVAAINASPNIEIPVWLYWLPPINAVQLFKELLQGEYDPVHIGMTLTSLFFASVIAIAVASRIFQRESILFKP